MAECRIGRVTYKKAPHLSEIIPAVRGREFREKMHEFTDTICGCYPEGLAGFAIIAWGFNGQFSCATRLHQDSFVGTTFLPSFVAEILRRDTVKDIATDIFTGEL